MSLADAELFLRRWFQAARWYAHLGSESRKALQMAHHASEERDDLTSRLEVQQSTAHDLSSQQPSVEMRQ